jgi:hypothetical protein
MKNITKRYKGGNNENLLDDNFIVSNLKDILNQTPFKYKFNIKITGKLQNKFYNVFVENEDQIIKDYNPDDNPCLEIKFVKYSEGISIFVYSINKCAPIKNYGNFILSCLKEFASKFGYHDVIITSDNSTIDLYFDDMNEKKLVYIELAYLSILSTGESWYNRMSFYHPNNIEEIEDNKIKINKKINTIDDSVTIIEHINNQIKKYKNRQNLIPVCVRLINSYGKFREMYNFILEITGKTEDDTIQSVFDSLNYYIKNHCNTINKTCDVDYLTIQKISCFIDFVYELLDINYHNTSLEYIAKNYKAGKNSKNSKNSKKNKKIKTKKNKLYM